MLFILAQEIQTEKMSEGEREREQRERENQERKREQRERENERERKRERVSEREIERERWYWVVKGKDSHHQADPLCDYSVRFHVLHSRPSPCTGKGITSA